MRLKRCDPLGHSEGAGFVNYNHGTGGCAVEMIRSPIWDDAPWRAQLSSARQDAELTTRDAAGLLGIAPIEYLYLEQGNLDFEDEADRIVAINKLLAEAART